MSALPLQERRSPAYLRMQIVAAIDAGAATLQGGHLTDCPCMQGWPVFSSSDNFGLDIRVRRQHEQVIGGDFAFPCTLHLFVSEG